jgi:sugar phosphate permease
VHTWQQLFLVEGIITMGISLIAFYTMTDHPGTARWLTPEQRELATARVQSENVGTTEVTDKWDKKKALAGVLNPNTLAVSWIFLFVNIAVQGIAFFTPTIIATIHPSATVIRKQLYTVPPYIVGFVVNLIIPFLSWKTDRRLIYFISSSCLAIMGYAMFVGTEHTATSIRTAGVYFCIAGSFPLGCLTNAQVAVNILSDTGRATGIGWNVMIGVSLTI